MYLKQFAIVMGIFALSGVANGGTLKGGYPVCFTEQAYQEAVKAMTRNDEVWWNQLRDRGQCFIAKSGAHVQRLEGGLGTCKLRMFTPDGASSAVVWTPCENYKP